MSRRNIEHKGQRLLAGFDAEARNEPGELRTKLARIRSQRRIENQPRFALIARELHRHDDFSIENDAAEGRSRRNADAERPLGLDSLLLLRLALRFLGGQRAAGQFRHDIGRQTRCKALPAFRQEIDKELLTRFLQVHLEGLRQGEAQGPAIGIVPRNGNVFRASIGNFV